MEFSIQLSEATSAVTVRELLEKEWLVPRKVRHFLRIRKNVQVNGELALFHFPVKVGDLITLHFEAEDYPTSQISHGDKTQIQPLFEDEHLIIVNKPVGSKTHPNQPDENDTLLNHLAAYLAPKGQMPYVVHRLDKETSGAIVFAKNPFVLPILGRLLAQKQIYRRYQAVVTGQPTKNEWTIQKKIGRDRHDRRKRVIDPRNGAHAVTHVQTVEIDQKKHQAAVYCLLETGRTHQIRVHLASEGLPIVGDPLYHPAPQGRLMLHAVELHMLHPLTKEKIHVQATPSLW